MQAACQWPAVSRRTVPRKISKGQGKSMPGSLCESTHLSGSEILHLSGGWTVWLMRLEAYLSLPKAEVWYSFRLHRGNSSRYNLKRWLCAFTVTNTWHSNVAGAWGLERNYAKTSRILFFSFLFLYKERKGWACQAKNGGVQTKVSTEASPGGAIHSKLLPW